MVVASAFQSFLVRALSSMAPTMKSPRFQQMGRRLGESSISRKAYLLAILATTSPCISICGALSPHQYIVQRSPLQQQPTMTTRTYRGTRWLRNSSVPRYQRRLRTSRCSNDISTNVATDSFQKGAKTNHSTQKNASTAAKVRNSRIIKLLRKCSMLIVSLGILALFSTNFRKYILPHGSSPVQWGARNLSFLRGGGRGRGSTILPKSSTPEHPALRLGDPAFSIDGKLDASRVRLRLEGLQSYSTISALLMNASLRLFSATIQPEYPSSSKSSENSKTHLHYMYNVFLAADILSVLLGAYTTIVFTMVSLYSKQALGRGLDIEFMNFYHATQVLRESGFATFVGSLMSFQLAFVGTLYCNLKGRKRYVFVTMAATIAATTGWMIRQVMASATKFIFS